MPNPDPRGFDPNLDLQTLNTQSGYKEDALGPLIKIGNDGTHTVLTYDTDQASPVVHATISADGATPTVGPDVVDSGKIFISGVLTNCTATRP